jgi:hypothetical protein
VISGAGKITKATGINPDPGAKNDLISRALMSDNSQLPKSSDFPPGTEFVIKEFDVPLVRIPGHGWFNWYGGEPRPYDPGYLRVDNNWPARSFEEWRELVESSLKDK